MTPQAEDVLQTALGLPSNERVAVAERLLESVSEPASDDFDAASLATFRRRIDEIESGKVELVSGQESQDRVQALLAELRM